ncbi:hypothetical protein NMG60_11035330 [Bertholletia excelsa]
MEELPESLIADILSRLSIISVIRCSCVCKSWRNLLLDSSFVGPHLGRSSQANPTLILYTLASVGASNTKLYFVDHLDSDEPTFSELSFSIPDLHEYCVIASCNGLLCLVNSRDVSEVCVYSPFLRQFIRLPSLVGDPGKAIVSAVGFGFSPRTKEYKVVASVQNVACGNRYTALLVCTLTRGSWRCIGCSDAMGWRINFGTFVNGSLHWIGLFGGKYINAFDLADERFAEMRGPKTGGSYHLGALGGWLAATHLSSKAHADVWIMKEHGVEDSWVKSYSVSLNDIGWEPGFVQALCFNGKGEVLLLLNKRTLISYNPESNKLRLVTIGGLPFGFDAVTHVPSLVQLREDRKLSE